jgi:hypothetical protein
MDGDGVGGAQLEFGDEIVAGQRLGDLLICSAPVLMPAASADQHGGIGAGQRECGGSGVSGLHHDLLGDPVRSRSGLSRTLSNEQLYDWSSAVGRRSIGT